MHHLPSAMEHSSPMPKRTKHTPYQRMGNDPSFDLRNELYRIAGVDLTDIPGLSAIAAQVVLTEIGPTSVDFVMPLPSHPGLDSARTKGSAEVKCCPRKHVR